MKIYPIRFWILLAILSWGSVIQARHIIGGVITYECLGNDQYQFTMKIYRDCNCTDCAEFDSNAFVAVYQCGQDTPCSSLDQNPNDWYTRVNVPLKSITQVAEPDYPCLIPPDVCVQEGLYEWTLTLPASDESYHISYQRCCRNVTISNIVQPQNSGATYTIEITPDAQLLCNSSPVFDRFTPIIICGGQPLEFDHSASDPDGDQLVYEFCSPLLGGGNLLDQFNYETCAGASPNPACPPPYNSVSFTAPTYTPLEPMGGDPVVRIDPFTGLITGTPTVLGQFVVGVCVSEYRDGVLLSRVFRDFQFNVASCDPLVVADILEDAIMGDQEFVVNSCGNSTISFINQSFQENYISQFSWRFDINGTTQEFSEWNPTVTFPGVGQYSGELLLNPGLDCGDTARIFVNVYPEINADFSFEYDTCVAGPVQFTDLSTTGSCCMTDWQWNFGDGTASNQPNPSHVFFTPGDIPVTLTVTDTNQCQDQATNLISYFPVPALIVIAPSEFQGCAPAEIFFNNLSFPIDTTYGIEWNFGDGGFSGEISPTYIYENPGSFTVSVDITSPIGCQTDTVFNDLITILPAPMAGYSFTPEQPNSLEPTVIFTDESSGAIGWQWDFGNGATSTLMSPVYTYPDTGLYAVQQVVVHPSGCRDTLIRFLDIRPEVRYFLPNAFTPNSDSVNDGFRGEGVMIGATDFSMTIWNRWGEMIFESSDPQEEWNGRKLNTGRESPAGVYVVLVKFIGPRGKRYEIKGFATLIR